MKYQFSIPTADLPAVNTPELGGESKRVYASYQEFAIAGSIAMTAPTSGTLTAAIPPFVPDQSLGADFQLRCKTAIVSASDVVVAFNVVFLDDVVGVAQAAFAVPAYAQNQSKSLPMGLCVDLTGTAGNSAKKIKTITSLASITGGSNGAQFELISLPDVWYFIQGCTSKAETLNVPKAKPIAWGLDGSAWTKFGLSEPGKIDFEALHISYGDGLQRWNGTPFTAMVEVWANDVILKERHIYGGCRGAFNADRKDGEDEVKDKGTAEFNKFAKVV